MSTFDYQRFWYRFVREKLALLQHAEVMYHCANSDDSRTVIFYGGRMLGESIAVGIGALNGMAGEW